MSTTAGTGAVLAAGPGGRLVLRVCGRPVWMAGSGWRLALRVRGGLIRLVGAGGRPIPLTGPWLRILLTLEA
ncbi:hypothetical protein GCM10011609_23200 [Lentzea pudingi]|uniref:Uncharacterized protein n=1 Tax=Lentzea pudingi TaxID=1789439 RepID=A0ABQ2HPZ7_9PSEU|nr:hypothetical protein GCM10011609_23200 [Lentzea pudingi]